MKTSPKLTPTARLLPLFVWTLGLTLIGGAFLHFGPRFLRGDDATAGGNIPQSGSTPTAESRQILPESQEALDTLHEAANRLFAHQSVNATIHETINLGVKPFTAEGSYLAGEFPRLRLEYQVTVGNTQGTVTEVCDGTLLRTFREIRRLDQPAPVTTPASAPDSGEEAAPPSEAETANAPSRTATRRDIRKMLDAVRKGGTTPEGVLQAQLGLGGLPALLASFERSMIFHGQRKEQIDGREFLIIQGRWRDEVIGQLRQQMATSQRDVSALLPDLVQVAFAADTLFPERIQYLRRLPGKELRLQPMLLIEFRDIEINQPIAANAFEVTLPADVEEVDLTIDYIDQINGVSSQPTP